ncbi:MAG: hypothetical protein AAF389_20055 [Gemmatimonadota bacterium]
MKARIIRTVVGVTGLGVLAACGDAARTDDVRTEVAESVVRDSAGITIVENQAPAGGPWRLSDEPVFEVLEDPDVERTPLDPTSVLALSDGRVVVGDGNQVGWHALLFFDDEGTFTQKVGGPGRGPGEFGGQLWSVESYRGDSLAAWDRRGPSMKIFGEDGGYSRDVPIPPAPRPTPEGTNGFSVGFHGAFSDGTLLSSSMGAVEEPQEVGPVWFRHFLLAVDPDGVSQDTIADVRFSQTYWNGERTSSYLFGAFGFHMPLGEHVLHATGEAPEYRVLDREGETRRIVRMPSDAVPVTEADIGQLLAFFESNLPPQVSAEQRAQMRQQMEATPVAPTKPPYSAVFVDDARNVWVERYRWFDSRSIPSNPTPTTWDIFSEEGTWLAELAAPAGIVLLSASGDRAFGTRIDEMGVRQVVGFQIER